MQHKNTHKDKQKVVDDEPPQCDDAALEWCIKTTQYAIVQREHFKMQIGRRVVTGDRLQKIVVEAIKQFKEKHGVIQVKKKKPSRTTAQDDIDSDDHDDGDEEEEE